MKMKPGGIKNNLEIIKTAAATISGATFIYGDAEKLNNTPKESADYPIINLARPIFKPANNNFDYSYLTTYNEINVFSVYDSNTTNEEAEENKITAEDQAAKICTDLFNYLLDLHNAEEIVLNLDDVEIQPILEDYIAGTVGYKLTVEFNTLIN